MQTKDSQKQDILVSSGATTSPCTYAVEPPCTGRYARWCERSALYLREPPTRLRWYSLIFAGNLQSAATLDAYEMPLKTKNAYRTLPLSADAINVLKIQKCKVGNNEWVFPSPTGGPMSPDSVLHILNADILDMLASTLMDDFASTSFAIVIHGITPLFFLMALFYRRRCPI